MKANIKNFIIAIAMVSGLGILGNSCNNNGELLYTLPSNATVRSFWLEADKKVLPNLDSVFFSIDLYSQEIYNADSLPFGTKVSALTPIITTENASVVELIVPTENDNDTTINYLENTSDTIDFRKPVKLRVVSYDGVTERTYTIKVNVHQVESDTMVWSRLEQGSLPTTFAVVNEQHTVMSPNGTLYCMTRYQNDYTIANTNDPGTKWNISPTVPDFVPDINSLAATNDALYILDTNGQLYTSSDQGVNWSTTGTQATALIGAYGNRLIGTLQNGSGWDILEYPAGTLTPAPNGFPVQNTSNPVAVTFEMSTSPQFLIVGGRTANGDVTGDTWGFDGNSWAKVSKNGLPKKIENMTLVPYFDIEPDTMSWRVSKPSTILMAMCGNHADGTLNDTVYISHDFGLNWQKAPNSLQIPSSVIPVRTRAQAYPFNGINYASNQIKKTIKNTKSYSFIENYMRWTEIENNTRSYFAAGRKNASAMITEWDVPYVYLFGGVNEQGVTYNTVFRGVITALTFKPLQ